MAVFDRKRWCLWLALLLHQADHRGVTLASSFGGRRSTATCAVESLKDTLVTPLQRSINWLKFDREAAAIRDEVRADEVIYAGVLA